MPYYKITIKHDETFKCDDCGTSITDTSAIIDINFSRSEVIGVYCRECKKVNAESSRIPEEAESIDV